MRVGTALQFALVACAISDMLVRGQDSQFPNCHTTRPCLNGGTCSAPAICNCVVGYTGDQCQTEVKCNDPGAPDHGSRSKSNFTVNSVVRFDCQTGYRLNSSSPFLCTSAGVWNSTTLPSCTVVTCPPLSAPRNGQLAGSALTYGSVMTFNCESGFRLGGSASRTCQANGAWSGAPASCSAVTCGKPAAPSGGSVIGSSFSYNSLVSFSCKDGYRLSFTNPIKCGAEGQWNQSVPACIEGCKSDADCMHTNLTKCCFVGGKPAICCRNGVQKILDDRYDNVPNGTCKTSLRNSLAFCAKNYIGCLNNLVNPPPSYKTCPNSHGCIPTASGCKGGSVRCHTSIAMDSGRWSNTSFCLTAECAGKSRATLDAVARSDGRQHCDTLEQLAGLHECPLNFVLIHCDDGTNGEFFPGYNPTPPPTGGDDNGKKAGNIIGIVFGIIAFIVLIIVIVVFYRHKKETGDSVDFERLEEDRSPLQREESEPARVQPTGEEGEDV